MPAIAINAKVPGSGTGQAQNSCWTETTALSFNRIVVRVEQAIHIKQCQTEVGKLKCIRIIWSQLDTEPVRIHPGRGHR